MRGFETIFWKVSVAILFVRQTRSNIWTAINVPTSQDRQPLYSPVPTPREERRGGGEGEEYYCSGKIV